MNHVISRTVLPRELFDRIGPQAANPYFTDDEVSRVTAHAIQFAEERYGAFTRGNEAVVRSALFWIIVAKRKKLRESFKKP